MPWLVRVAGVALVAVALADVYVTTIAASLGGGPVTRLMSRTLWRARMRLPAEW